MRGSRLRTPGRPCPPHARTAGSAHRSGSSWRRRAPSSAGWFAAARQRRPCTRTERVAQLVERDLAPTGIADRLLESARELRAIERVAGVRVAEDQGAVGGIGGAGPQLLERFGGDEFGVLAPDLTADALRSALDGLKEGDGAKATIRDRIDHRLNHAAARDRQKLPLPHGLVLHLRGRSHCLRACLLHQSSILRQLGVAYDPSSLAGRRDGPRSSVTIPRALVNARRAPGGGA